MLAHYKPAFQPTTQTGVGVFIPGKRLYRMKTRHALKQKIAQKKNRRANRVRGRKNDDEESEVFELATGENAPMFWGDVDKKLLHNRTLKRKMNTRTQNKKKQRRNN